MKKFLLSIPLAASICFAQEESSLQFNGFVDSYHALQTDYPHEILSSRTRMRGELRMDYENASLYASFNAIYNGVVKNSSGINLHEAYLDYANGTIDVKVGRQIVAWGVADGLRVTDLISPLDYTEFLTKDYDDTRISINAVDFKYTGENAMAEFIFVPVPEYFQFPETTDNPWYFKTLPENAELELNNYPEKRIKYSEYGTRLRFFLESLDISIMALHTYNKLPVMVSSYDFNTGAILVKGVYEPMTVFGGDISMPIGEFVFRGEIAEYFHEPLALASGTAYCHKNTFNALAGIDWYAGNNWTFMVQYLHKYLADYEKRLSSEKNTSQGTFRISKDLLNNTLKLSLYGMIDFDNKSYYGRLSADYQLNDQITLSLGYDLFGGDKGQLASYEENSGVWAKAKYFF